MVSALNQNGGNKIMIVTEVYGEFSPGVNLIRTYSDQGYKIERDGVRYDEAIDPENMGRVYTETDELIPRDEEADDAEALELLNILLGGEEETPDEGGN